MLSVVTIESATLRKEDVRMSEDFLWGVLVGAVPVWLVMNAFNQRCLKLIQEWSDWAEGMGFTRVARHD